MLGSGVTGGQRSRRKSYLNQLTRLEFGDSLSAALPCLMDNGRKSERSAKLAPLGTIIHGRIKVLMKFNLQTGRDAT
ncbi:hypothetical protein RRG08_055076 [Elysia crispata]|uniref:Uncharacterized protein n=1 Tax=Elysia crispata TaxID=231223 RepID=A0AAE1B0J2_9GAST|nr:hypothetical protein RRG08_055076 [Elysia crispata]